MPIEGRARIARWESKKFSQIHSKSQGKSLILLKVLVPVFFPICLQCKPALIY